MKHSEMLNLNLPEDSDLINVGQISDNFERLDSVVDILPVQQEITTTDIDKTVYPPYWSMTNNTDSNIAYIDHKFFDEEFVIKPGQTIRTDIDTPTEISISSEVTIDYVYYIPAKDAFSGGGGGGGGDTSDYNKLSNQPKINGVKLVGDKSASDLGLAAASDLSDKVSSSEKGVSNGIATLDADGKVPQSQLPTVVQKEYKLTETTSESYAKSYKLQVKNGETWSDVSESASINIPKDMVVESGSVKTCTEADTPVQGYVVGDKYIDLVIANADDEHIYLLVSDLVNNAADGISYDNTESELEAENVQEAIDAMNTAIQSKVSFTNLATSFKTGVVKAGGGLAMGISGSVPNGNLYINKATDAQIEAGTEIYRPIVPSNLGKAMSVYGIKDKNYIKNKVTAPQTAEVGQVLAVKAVDEEGRPTEWECVNGGGKLPTLVDKMWIPGKILPYAAGSGSCILVYKGEIHILGSDKTADRTKHYKWDGNEWISASTLPYNFYAGNAVVYNDEIHILGGNSVTADRLKHYKWDGVNWSPVSNLPFNSWGAGAAVYEDEIYIIGSADSSYGGYVAKWNGVNWSILRSIAGINNGLIALTYRDSLYYFGGVNSYYYYRYIKNTDSWERFGELPCEVNGGCDIVVCEDEIHLFGNSNTSNHFNGYHYKYSPSYGWKTIEVLPFMFYGKNKAAVAGSQIYITGDRGTDYPLHVYTRLN